MPADPESQPGPFSLWSLAAACGWSFALATLASCFSPHMEGFAGSVAISAYNLALVAALAFPLVLVGDTLFRPRKFSPPSLPDSPRPSALVVEEAGDPMRLPTGWRPSFYLRAASKRSALTTFTLLLVWRALAYVPGLPPTHPASLTVLAAAVLLPVFFIAREALSAPR